LKISQTTEGLLYGFLAYSMWGIFPLFFHLLRDIPSTEVLLHRVIWSFVFVLVILMVKGWYRRLLEAVRKPALIRGLVFSALLVSLNWLIYIWAVGQGRVVESSLGYFLTPLVSVFLARVFLQERLNRKQQLAIVFAFLGIIWLVVRLGYLPWVSLTLATSFGLYGLVRKRLEIDTLTGLTVETGLMFPLALSYWFYLIQHNADHFFQAPDSYTLLLLACGAVTSIPLLLFASATKKLTLSIIGFMMYINPTMQFFIALFILKEPFSHDQFIGFCFIWVGLIVFTLGSIKRRSQLVRD
jgi:chloramphenicol-sensitive protein RarD